MLYFERGDKVYSKNHGYGEIVSGLANKIKNDFYYIVKHENEIVDELSLDLTLIERNK